MKQLTTAAFLALLAGGCGSTISQHAKAATFLNDVSAIAHDEITEKLAQEAADCTDGVVVTDECVDAAMERGAAVVEAAATFDRAVASYAAGVLAATEDGSVEEKAPPLLRKALEVYEALRGGLRAWADKELPEVPGFVAGMIGGAQ